MAHFQMVNRIKQQEWLAQLSQVIPQKRQLIKEYCDDEYLLLIHVVILDFCARECIGWDKSKEVCLGQLSD